MAKKCGPCSKLFQAPLWGCHFFILSHSPLRGFSIPLPYSVPISSSLSVFLFHLWCSLFFFLWFLQAVWFFFIVPSMLSQDSVFLSPPLSFCILSTFISPHSLSVSPLSIFFDFFSPVQPNPAHKLCLSSSLWTLSFLHLNPFDQDPVCTFPFPPSPSSFPSFSSFTLFCAYSLVFPPLSGLKSVFTLDRCDAPGLLNQWRGYICASARSHQT